MTDANTAEQKRLLERKRNVLVLINQHLIENGTVFNIAFWKYLNLNIFRVRRNRREVAARSGACDLKGILKLQGLLLCHIEFVRSLKRRIIWIYH